MQVDKLNRAHGVASSNKDSHLTSQVGMMMQATVSSPSSVVPAFYGHQCTGHVERQHCSTRLEAGGRNLVCEAIGLYVQHATFRVWLVCMSVATAA